MTSRTTGECTDTHTRMGDIWMDDQTRMKMKIVMVNRRDIRALFGITFANQQGHFTDECMSPIIYAYSNWVAYPKGDHVLEGHSDNVFAAVFSSDGYYLFTGSIDRSIIKWNLLSNTFDSRWTAHACYVSCLDYHRSGLLVSGSTLGSIRVWNANNHKLIFDLKGHERYIRSVKVNKQGTQMVSTSDDKTIRLWSLNNGECLRTFSSDTEVVYSVCFSPDGSIVSGGLDNVLRVWDVSKGSYTCPNSTGMEAGWQEYFEDIRFNCDSSMIACTFSNLRCRVYRWPSLDIIHRIEHSVHGCDFHPSVPHWMVLAVRKPGPFSSIASDDPNVLFLDIRPKKKKSSKFYRVTERIGCVRFSPNGALLAAFDFSSNRVVVFAPPPHLFDL